MKKFIRQPAIFIASLLTLAVFVLPSAASAQDGTNTVDDRALDSATEGMPPERQSVEFEQPSASQGQTTSGYTDENGNPLTYDEFIERRKEMDKGVFEKYPIPSALVVLAIVGGITYLVVRRKKKKA